MLARCEISSEKFRAEITVVLYIHTLAEQRIPLVKKGIAFVFDVLFVVCNNEKIALGTVEFNINGPPFSVPTLAT
jgi:hypothetical protein